MYLQIWTHDDLFQADWKAVLLEVQLASYENPCRPFKVGFPPAHKAKSIGRFNRLACGGIGDGGGAWRGPAARPPYSNSTVTLQYLENFNMG